MPDPRLIDWEVGVHRAVRDQPGPFPGTVMKATSDLRPGMRIQMALGAFTITAAGPDATDPERIRLSMAPTVPDPERRPISFRAPVSELKCVYTASTTCSPRCPHDVQQGGPACA